MLNKDKRSLCLMLVLGDGCLHLQKNKYGCITIDHGIDQADYQSWKAKLLSDIFERDVKVRTGHKGKSVQVSVCNNVLKAWRKFTYPGGKKDLSRILPFIRQPEMALAVWLMDDGYCEPSFSKLEDGSKKNYGARFRLFTCDQSLKTQELLIDWFEKTFNIKPVIKISKQNTRGKEYPFLKFNQQDSLDIWHKIREFILQFKSMRYKFRYIEEIYQKRMTQCAPSNS